MAIATAMIIAAPTPTTAYIIGVVSTTSVTTPGDVEDAAGPTAADVAAPELP